MRKLSDTDRSSGVSRGSLVASLTRYWTNRPGGAIDRRSGRIGLVDRPSGPGLVGFTHVARIELEARSTYQEGIASPAQSSRSG